MLKRVMRGLLWAAAISVGAHASAEIVTFEFCGHTIQANPMAREGAPVVGQFSWDTSASGWFRFGGPPLTYYRAPATGPLSFLVGPHKVAAENTSVLVYNDTQSNVGDMIDINAQAPVIDGTTLRNGYVSIRLASSPENTSVFDDTSLPSELDVAKFDSVGVNYFQMFGGVVANDMLLDVKLDWIRRAADARPGESERRLCVPSPASR